LKGGELYRFEFSFSMYHLERGGTRRHVGQVKITNALDVPQKEPVRCKNILENLGGGEEKGKKSGIGRA